MKCQLAFPLSLVVLTSSCLDAPTPGAPILTKCSGVEGVEIEAEFVLPCAELETQVLGAKAQVPGLVAQGVKVIYRDADFFKCDDSLCAVKDLGYWHGENWPNSEIELTRTGKLLLHEFFHQVDAETLKTGQIGDDHAGWNENGRTVADYKYRSTEALRL